MTRTADYDYLLPPELIAQEPAEQRDRSRLLVLDRRTGACSDHGFGELPALLPPGALLVLNNSRVFPARLLGRKPTGGAVELLLVRREPDPRARWVALARTSKKLRAGQAIAFDHHRVTCRVEALLDDGAVRVEIEGFEDPASPHRESFQAWLERVGETPLPPYIQREGGERPFDRERYQTVYAGPTGSVAAPTAGLHFTPALLATLQERGIERAFVTLHVGPGTFRPVRAERAEDHVMDAEHGLLPSETVEAVERALAAGRAVVAVGTTTVRALEGIAARHGGLVPGPFATDLYIRPGFRFQVVDGLITNFHLPRSTLLMLVSAFAGRERILRAYRHAVRQRYRFYSYGDAMLIR